MEWDDELIGRLRGLWDEGHSTAEIGRRLSVSKNAIVGKAHRLSLPARPSPIRRGGTPASRVVKRRMVGPTLPPLPAHDAVAARKPVASPPPVAAAPPVAAPKPRPLASVSRAVTAMPQRGSRLVCCCWPIGEPGTPSFHFCDEGALAGKPYCAEHAQLAYVKVRDRREEAA